MRARLPLFAFGSAVALAAAFAAPIAAHAASVPAAPAPAAPVAAETPLPGPVPQGRLPDAVIPSAYRLDLTLDPAQPGFSGHAEIDASLQAASTTVWIDGRNLTVHRVTARIGTRQIAGDWRQVDASGVALLSFPEALPAGPVTFAFDYDGRFLDGPQGLFHVKVGEQWYGWSQFESSDARAAYPAFDQPGYKQPFTVTLRTPAGLKAISNAPETGISHDGAWDTHHFAPTAPLPTYLLAMMVGPFAEAATTVPPTPERATPLPLRIVSTQNNAGDLAFPLANAPEIVSRLEAYFGQAFPYPKLDLITAPVMPGAMENAGADLFQDDLLVMSEHPSPSQQRAFGMVVAHELAHQWFGDLVTPAWWDDIWLNESFANWMGYRIGDAWRPGIDLHAGAIDEAFTAMRTDALVAGRPIHQPIPTTAAIDAAFDSITYGKGAQVVGMIAAYMGDDRFQAGVRHYMAAHRYGNATSAQFFAAMAEVAGDPRLLPAMQGFVDQQGVPLIRFTPTADGMMRVTQSRYAHLDTEAPETHWTVPLCLRLDEARQCNLLGPEGADLTVPANALLVPNAGGTGYYRFEVPQAQWDRLIATSASLPAGEGLALADSLLASFQAGRAHAGALARLAKVMSANPDPYAAKASRAGMEWIAGTGMLDGAAAERWRKILRDTLGPQLKPLGFDPRAGAYAAEPAAQTQRRIDLVNALAGSGRDDRLRKQLRDAADAWLRGDTSALDPAFYNPAFAQWIQDAGMSGAHGLLEHALASQDPLARPDMFRALAESGQHDIAAWLLDGVHDPRLRLSERLDMVTGVLGNANTRDFGYDWVHGHLDTLLGEGTGIFFASRLADRMQGFCSVDRAATIARDLGPRLKGTTGELDLARTVEMVRDCGRLKEARGGEASAEVAGMR